MGRIMALTPVKSMIQTARRSIQNLTPQEVAKRSKDEDVVLVDLREAAELQEQGTITGAVHIPRGMLEFCADPSTPYHNEALGPDRSVILFCASGGRSALAAASLREMGYGDVAHLDGGFKAWQAEGQPVRNQ